MGPGLLLSRHGEVILETSAPVLTWELRKGREAGLCQTRRSGGTANASADSARTACTGPCLLFNPPRGLAQCLPGRHSRHAKSTSAATFSNSYDLATAPPRPPPAPKQGEQVERGAGQSSVTATSTVLSLGMYPSCLSTPSLVCTLANWIPTASQSWSVDNGDAQGHKQAAAVGVKAVDMQSPARSGPTLQPSGRSLAPLRA